MLVSVIPAIVDVEKAIVAIAESELASDVVQICPGAEHIRVLADEHQPAAVGDEGFDGGDLGGIKLLGGDFDDQHVAGAQRLIVDLAVDARDIVEMREIIVEDFVGVGGLVAVGVGVKGRVGRLPDAIAG